MDDLEFIGLQKRIKVITEERNTSNLALATLCDMVLGEDAEDRSNDALIRAVRELLNRKDFTWEKQP